MDTKITDGLDKVRASAQELHATISDLAAKRGADAKADFESIPQKVKALNDSLKSSMSGQGDAVKKSLAGAVTDLEAAQKHANEGLKANGQAFQTSVRQTLADARASVQKVSEAVAAKRSAQSAPASR
jgi:ElaB/YqjD/DUF883 family membrane-anchored ribosome-binding protein